MSIIHTWNLLVVYEKIHTYSSVGIVYEKIPGVIATHPFSDIAVKSCGCKLWYINFIPEHARKIICRK